jgi:nitroimidazol reductase NimA-like FMN-containing flavoprotein (pyridoxamine 5'-phosphate oxidase superfamily)
MLEISDMTRSEIETLLDRVKYGHLGCARNNHPYVVPIHFTLDDGTIYIFTTEGMKSEMIDTNPEVCLQAEEIVDDEHWSSVVIIGDAERLRNPNERARALEKITSANPSLTPAINYRWVDAWVREQKDIEVVYRINRKTTTGRRAGAN